jgi:hypothetical protein
MKRLPIILLTLLSISSITASADYRVDILIFNHIEGVAEIRETTEIRSFASLPQLDDVLLPDGMQAITAMSASMESIWRRFRRSAGYRPLLYVSWVQSKIDYNPPLRVHDEVILSESLQFPSRLVIADLTADDPLAAYRVPFYQLDGTVQLRLSRFLHLELDLEFREILPDGVAGEPVPASLGAQMFPPVIEEAAQDESRINYEVRKLEQSRQVRTNETQYFDSPFIGVIAHVTEIN